MKGLNILLWKTHTKLPRQYDEYRHQYKTITPSQAKRLSKKLPVIPVWSDEVKIYVMQSLLYQKFTPENELGRQLMGTGDAILIEGNTWGDVFWGKCDGVGKNILGLILTNRRNTLKCGV